MLMCKATLAAVAVLSLGFFAAGTTLRMHAQVRADQLDRAERQDATKSADAKVREERLNRFLAGKLAENEFSLPTLTRAERDALFSRFKINEKLKALFKDQLLAAQQENEAGFREFLEGRGTIDVLIAASLRLLRAKLPLCDKHNDRLNSLETHLQRMKVITHVNQQRLNAGRIEVMDLAHTKFYRAQAEIWFELTKSGKKVYPVDWYEGGVP